MIVRLSQVRNVRLFLEKQEIDETSQHGNLLAPLICKHMTRARCEWLPPMFGAMTTLA
jgi:hypothetical protein